MLDFDAYDRWSWILYPSISTDGRWVAYTQVSGAGVGSLVVRETTGTAEFHTPLGVVARSKTYLPPPGFGPAKISSDSKSVVFTVLGSSASDKHIQLGIMQLPNGHVDLISHVRSFSVPEAIGQHVAYFAEEPANGLPTSVLPKISGEPQGATVQGHALTILDLRSRRKTVIRNVVDYLFDAQEKFVLYIAITGSDRSGVYALRLSDKSVSTLLEGRQHFSHLTLDSEGHQVAFLADQPEADEPRGPYTLYYAASTRSAAVPAVQASALLEHGLEITPQFTPRFTPTGATLTFGVIPESTLASTRLQARNDQINVELWHWKEPKPLQNAIYTPQPQCGAYTVAYQIAQHRWIQLEDASAPFALLGADGSHAVGVRTYPLRDTWDSPLVDLAVIDAQTGRRHFVRHGLKPGYQPWLLNATDSGHCKQLQTMFTLSPTGRYLMYFESQRWWSVDLESSHATDLTGKLLQETTFGGNPPYSQASQNTLSAIASGGIAGWMVGEHEVLIYSDKDIWALDPSGVRAPRNLTRRINDSGNIVYRLLDRDADFALKYPNGVDRKATSLSGRRTQFIDPAAPLMLIGVDQRSMSVSIWSMDLLSSKAPRLLTRKDKWLTPIARARDAEQYLFTEESFEEFPDLWVGPTIEKLHRISDVNPQQREYRWGTAELIDFTSDFGVPLKGKLYKPEGFDPSRRYPMLVGIYESASATFHHYFNPQPMSGASVTEGWPTAVSRGYLYFVPDVAATAPYPAQSALAAVIPGVQAVISRGYVDPSRVALLGHSFGGFEVNYIITQTRLFRCAVSGAGVTDMMSFATGSTHDTLSTERGQYRQGGSISERPLVYLSNSPLLYAQQVFTPLLMIHNDQDGPVPFFQSLEFFRTLRRNGKEVYLLNYRGESHLLRKYADRKDWETRLFEYLDYYLKDSPRPIWLGPSSSQDNLEEFVDDSAGMLTSSSTAAP